jgi:hypothetical protein
MEARWRSEEDQEKERPQLVEGTKVQFDEDDRIRPDGRCRRRLCGTTPRAGAARRRLREGQASASQAMSASKLMNGRDHPNVVKAIRAEQEEMRQKYAITPAKTGAMLWKIAEVSFESGAYNAAVSAVKELNQLAGLTIQRSQNLNINASLDNMTKKEITKRLNELLGVSEEMKDNDLMN